MAVDIKHVSVDVTEMHTLSHQVKIAYPNLYLDKTYLLNLGCPILIRLPSLHLHCLPSHNLCLQCLVLTSMNPICLQICHQ